MRNVDRVTKEADQNRLAPTEFVKNKPVILIATDSPVVSTGFGKVCERLCKGLLNTGKYQVVVMGTNDRGYWHPIRNMDPENFIIEPLPYIQEDPYGTSYLADILNKYNPDLVISINDIWVWTGDDRHQQSLNWFHNILKRYKPYVPWIGYFPVDGRPWDHKWVDLVNKMTFACTFTDYGNKVLSQTDDVDMDKVKIIYHGHDTENFFPIENQDEINQVRDALQIPQNTFVIGCINRNQPRKNIPALLQAFKMFRDGYVVCECGHYRNKDIMPDCEICGSVNFSEEVEGIKDSYLYLHMNPMDPRGYIIPKIHRDLKLENVISMSGNFDVAKGVAIEDLNRIYNTCDVIVNTTAAGGYELTVAEAMAAGRPVVSTRTTSVTEQLEDERGYLVNPATYMVWEDANHCYKHIIDINKLVDTLRHVYFNRDEAKQRGLNGIPFSKERSWGKAVDQFEQLIDKALEDRDFVTDHVVTDKPNILFGFETDYFGHAIALIPSLNKFAEANQGLNIVLTMDKKYHNLMTGLSKNIKLMDFSKMWLDAQELNDKQIRLQIKSLAEIPDRLEHAAMAFNNQMLPPHPVESFIKAFNVNITEDDLNKSYTITEDERINAISRLDSLGVDTDNFKLLITDHVVDKANKLDPNLVNELATKVLKNTKQLTVILAGKSFEKIDYEYKITDLSNRELIALIEQVDCVLTSSEALPYMGMFFNTPFIIVQGNRNLSSSLGLSKARKADGSPATFIVNGNMSTGKLSITAGDIFGKIIAAKNDYIKRKKYIEVQSNIKNNEEENVVEEKSE